MNFRDRYLNCIRAKMRNETIPYIEKQMKLDIYVDVFRFTVYKIFDVFLDLKDFNVELNLIENDFKSCIKYLRAVCMKQGINKSEYVRYAFIKDFGAYCKALETQNITNYQERYKNIMIGCNALYNLIGFCKKEYALIIDNLGYKKELIYSFDEVIEIINTFKEAIKPVNKYNKFVGMNLKQWRLKNAN